MVDKPKIFVRERCNVSEWEKKPLFNVVGVVGTDLKIYVKHIRKLEVEEIAKQIGADLIYLESGKKDELEEDDDD